MEELSDENLENLQEFIETLQNVLPNSNNRLEYLLIIKNFICLKYFKFWLYKSLFYMYKY